MFFPVTGSVDSKEFLALRIPAALCCNLFTISRNDIITKSQTCHMSDTKTHYTRNIFRIILKIEYFTFLQSMKIIIV